MAKLSKRVQALRAKVDRNRNYPLADALARRAVNDGTAGRAQRWHAAGVIAVVVRD